MKVLKNAGSFKILSKTEDIIWQIVNAARTCYQSHEFATSEKDESLVKHLIDRGHHAMLEFADMTVQFNDICRGFTHEMVRHRLCSFAQESTRYVDESDFKVVLPPHKEEIQDDISISGWFQENEDTYKYLRTHGWKPEDARQVLPIAIKSQICVKANMREWRHIFTMRCDKFAHWEIRGVMLQLLKYCKENIPLIFDDFYFFDNNNYARPIPSKVKIKDLLKHYVQIANTEDIEELSKEL